MKTLHLNLKKQWFDLIFSGEKKEEYREITDYWIQRFFKCESEIQEIILQKSLLSIEFFEQLNKDLQTEWNKIEFQNNLKRYLKKYDTITFSNGYAKDRPQFVIELLEISIGFGKEKWGAKKGEKYFILKLGKIININK